MAERLLTSRQIPWGSIEEGFCPKMEDATHCVHWWDGGKCCACGAGPMTAKEKREAGMLDEEKP